MRNPLDTPEGSRTLRGQHTLVLHSAYGDVLASEEVCTADFPAALRRFHDQALERASSVIVIDGITHSRNAFLEFVREFRDCEARTQRTHVH